ncbi:MAG: hypothetical protein JNJ54_29930 [Myxococcaceae bacterium]|nr:hypothetical protein [Myxococcaceae bacterium]
MKLVGVPLLVLLWSPVPAKAPSATSNDDCATETAAPLAIGDDAVTKCKRSCNSRCAAANNKSKCVAECRRACER